MDYRLYHAVNNFMAENRWLAHAVNDVQSVLVILIAVFDWLGISAYVTGMLLLANMGRTVRLEPLMNAFLIAGRVQNPPHRIYNLGGPEALTVAAIADIAEGGFEVE